MFVHVCSTCPYSLPQKRLHSCWRDNVFQKFTMFPDEMNRFTHTHACFKLLCLHVKCPYAGRIPVWWVWVSGRGVHLFDLCCLPPPVSFISLRALPKVVRSVLRCQGTYIQVTEVLVVVQGIADNKVVGDFESNIYQNKQKWILKSGIRVQIHFFQLSTHILRTQEGFNPLMSYWGFWTLDSGLLCSQFLSRAC